MATFSKPPSLEFLTQREQQISSILFQSSSQDPPEWLRQGLTGCSEADWIFILAVFWVLQLKKISLFWCGRCFSSPPVRLGCLGCVHGTLHESLTTPSLCKGPQSFGSHTPNPGWYNESTLQQGRASLIFFKNDISYFPCLFVPSGPLGKYVEWPGKFPIAHLKRVIFKRPQNQLFVRADFGVWLHFEQWLLSGLVTRVRLFFLNLWQNSSSRQKTQLPFNIKMDSLALNNKADNFIWSLGYRISLFEILAEKHYLIAPNNQPQWAPRKRLCPGLFWDSDPDGSFAQK